MADSRCLSLLLFALLLTGCTMQPVPRETLDILGSGEFEAGLARLEVAVTQAPTAERHATYIAQREFVINHLLAQASAARALNNHDAARAHYDRILGIEPGHSRAQDGLKQLERDQSHAQMATEGLSALAKNDIDRARTLAGQIHAENPDNPELKRLRSEISKALVHTELTHPELHPRFTEPVSLAFRNASVAIVFEALAQATGLNFILDPELSLETRTTIFLNNTRIEDAIELLRRTNRLGLKVIDSNTVVVYPDTPAKANEYEELLVRSFYLSNADVSKVQASLQALLGLEGTVIDDKLNLLILRESPERIRLAERIIAMHDIPEPEVMLEVEVLEVSRNRLTDLGVQWPNQIALSPLSASGAASGLTLDDLRNLNSSRIGVGIGPTTINLRRELGDANVLANPRIRARNRESAEILIGDRVPIITTTTTATGFASESIQYLDVGLKLEVVPTVFFGDDVSIKVALEVSSLGREITASSGTLAYQIGTRNASTTLQLRDGETQILAGLISDEERNATTRVPGLGDLPVIGRLFSNQRDNASKTEIVLSITPRIVRGLVRPDAAASEFWSGTAASAGIRPIIFRGPDAIAKTPSAPLPPQKAAPQPEPSPQSSLTMSEPTSVAVKWLPPEKLKPEEPFTVALVLSSDGGLRNLPLQIAFDSEALQIVDIVEGDYFKRDRSESSFTHHVDIVSGRILISAGRIGIEGVRGEANIGTLTLRGAPGHDRATLRLLSATAITAGDQAVPAVLPPPLTLELQ